ncbi:MAG: hypothetical protein AAGA81_20230 [Acidobacteriota bacterium]
MSMPTLQKYLKQHANKIPWDGEGRKRRYPLEVIDIVKELKSSGLKARGRGTGRRAKKATPKKSEGLLSLKRIQELTGISYPTLLRYVRLYSDQLPSVGSGRTRRYRPEAVPIFRELRSKSRGGSKASAKTTVDSGMSSAQLRQIDGRLARLEKSQALLQQEIRELVRVLKKPVKITVGR